MPHRSRSHRRSSHVVMVTPLDRAAPLPLEHPSRDHLQGAGFRSFGAAWADTTTAPERTVCYQAAIHSRGGAARASDMRSRGLSSPDVRHVAIGHGEAAHVSLAPGPEPCSLIATVAPRLSRQGSEWLDLGSGRALRGFVTITGWLGREFADRLRHSVRRLIPTDSNRPHFWGTQGPGLSLTEQVYRR